MVHSTNYLETGPPMPKAFGARLTITSPFAVYTQYILFITFHKVDPSVQELNATTAAEAVAFETLAFMAVGLGDFFAHHSSLTHSQVT